MLRGQGRMMADNDPRDAGSRWRSMIGPSGPIVQGRCWAA
jgi:hypothetical protein